MFAWTPQREGRKCRNLGPKRNFVAAPEMVTPHLERRAGADSRLLASICAWAALLIPAVVALGRLHLWAEWRDDLGVLRSVGLLPIGGEGVVSSALSQVFLALPVQGRALRAALLGVVALGLFGRLLFSMSYALLRRHSVMPRLTPLLALAASLVATLCSVAQREATTVGGGAVAACIGLGALLMRAHWDADDARRWAGLGVLVGLAAAENHAFAFALVLGLVLQALVQVEMPTPRSLGLAAVAFLLTGSLCLLPTFLRPLSHRAWVDLGLAWSRGAVVDSDPVSVVQAWMSALGPVHAALALGGVVLVFFDVRGRALLLPSLAFFLVDALAPTRGDDLFLPDSLLAVRLLAIGAAAVASSIAVQSVVQVLRTTALPLARPAASLLVAFTFTLVLISAEDSERELNRSAARASEAWTREALDELPRGALALVHSPELAWRLWAAQALSGRRQDVVVVPIHLLGHGSVASSLLRIEPALVPMIREISVEGRPSEFALSTLADSRPLFVEFDMDWQGPLMDHVTPELLWFRFEPHSVGRTDRKIALGGDHSALLRILDAATTPTARDEATISVVATHTRTKATVLAALGDRDGVQQLLGHLRRLRPSDRFLDEMEQRLQREPRGSVDIAGLLD